MGKVVLITGGSSGIGKTVGNFLQKKGYRVYGSSRNPQQVTDSLFPLVAIDVRNSETIQQAVQEIIRKEGKIDVLINNAGVGITGPVEEIPLEEIQNNFHTNVFKIRFDHQCNIYCRLYGIALSRDLFGIERCFGINYGIDQNGSKTV